MAVGQIRMITFSVPAQALPFAEICEKTRVCSYESPGPKLFESNFFQETGHILFEIATKEPGFAIDEPLENLGDTLKLPAQYEKLREKLANILIPFEMDS